MELHHNDDGVKNYFTAKNAKPTGKPRGIVEVAVALVSELVVMIMIMYNVCMYC